MKIRSAVLAVILAASFCAAQTAPAPTTPAGDQPTAPAPAPKPSQANGQAAAPTAPNSQAKQGDRSQAYYHYTLAHMYEELVSIYQSTEFANKAIEEYKLAIESDPSSEYLNSFSWVARTCTTLKS